MKESENNNEESFFSSVVSASQYSDVCGDYEQIVRVSKDLGPTTQSPPINNIEKNENNEDDVNEDNKLENIEEKLNKSNNDNIKNSLPFPLDENSSNKNENLFNEKRRLTSSIKEVENDSEENLDNNDNTINNNININNSSNFKINLQNKNYLINELNLNK